MRKPRIFNGISALLPYWLIAVLFMGSSYSQTFNMFIEQVNTAPPELKAALVDSFMTTVPEIPYIEQDTLVHFIYRNSIQNISIAGDATGWEPSLPMTQLPGTDFWYASINYESDARLDYKFVVNGSDWILDPLNPHQIPSGFGENSELRMPEWEYPGEINAYDDIPHGTIEDTTFYSVQLGNSRTVRVYLPPAYFVTDDLYPLIIFHDGLEYLSLAHADNIFDYLIQAETMRPVIGVFIPPIARNREYSGDLQDEFTAFIVDEMMPWLESRYRVSSNPEDHATLGASNGGNIALWLGYTHPEVFTHIAAQSSNVQSSISNGIAGSPHLDLNFYIDIGTYDIPVLIPLVENLHEILLANNYPVTYQVIHEGHSWGNWRAHLITPLALFFPFDPERCTTLYGADAFIDDCGVCSGGTSGHGANSDLDDCGICFGTNSCLGCTDPAALNYNPYATIDDGSCGYPQTVTLYFGQADESTGTLDIWMDNPGPASCWGFQFVISGIMLTGASGGSSQEFGIFPVATGPNGTVLGLNMNQSSIPPGDALLTTLTFSEILSDSSCLGEAVISGGPGVGGLAVAYDSCHPFGTTIPGCTDPSALNFDPEVNLDDGSCEYNPAGDLNQSGGLDILDIVILVEIILNAEPTSFELEIADFNGDGILDVTDILVAVSTKMAT